MTPDALDAPRNMALLILAQVAARHGCAKRDILGKRAKNQKARAEAILRIRAELGFSFPRVGRLLGCHHTTAVKCVAKYGEQLAKGQTA